MQMVQNTVVLSVGEQSWMIQVWNFDSVPSVMEITSIVRIILLAKWPSTEGWPYVPLPELSDITIEVLCNPVWEFNK